MLPVPSHDIYDALMSNNGFNASDQIAFNKIDPDLHLFNC